MLVGILKFNLLVCCMLHCMLSALYSYFHYTMACSYPAQFRLMVAKEAKRMGNITRCASKYGVPRCTISRWVALLAGMGISSRKNKCGRKAKVLATHSATIRQRLKKDQRSVREL